MKILHLFVVLCLIASIGCVNKESHLTESANKEPIQKLSLDNGLTVIIKSSDKVPLIAVRLVIKAGLVTEGEFTGSGISHFVEHMLFKGTATRPVGQIEKQIKSYGGYINASTSHDTTEVYLIVKKQYLNQTLELLSDLVFNPSFDNSELTKEKEVILSEIRMNRDEPSRRISALLWENAYLAHPYHYPVIGYEELFKNLTKGDLLRYHNENYTPGNCVISIVGDIDARAACQSVKDIFGKLPRKSDTISPDFKEPLQISNRRAEEEIPQLKLSRVMIAFHSTALTSKDLYPFDLLSAALGAGESSRLHKRLVRDRKLAYSVSAYNYTPKDPGLFIISFSCDEDNADKAIAEILDEIELIKARSLSGKELDKIKKSVLSSFIYSRESIEGQANDYASSYAACGDYDFSSRYVRGIGAVQRRDVLMVANRYFSTDNMTIAVIKATAKPSVGAVPAQIKNNESRIQKTLLPNGAVILTREDHLLPIVSIGVLFKGGVRAENKDSNGISCLMSEALLKGTKYHSAEWIAREVDSRGIDLTSFSGKNSFGISAKCLKEDLNFCMDLIGDILVNADFPEKEISISKELQLAAIKEQDDDIFASASKELVKTIFKAHPYGMPDLGTKDSVKGLSREDILRYYRRYVAADNMVVTVFGDIDTNKTLKNAGLIFGRLRGKTGKVGVASEAQQTELRQSLKQMPKEQAVLMIGYPGCDVKNPDRYTLDVINSILSREGGRLYVAIRERMGLSYTLGSFSVLGIDPGYNVLYVATSSKNIDEAKRLLLGQLKSLKSDGPTQEEMDLAKSGLSGGYFRALEINSELGFKSGLDELYGLGYDNIFKYPAQIESVTAEDVIRVAKKYFVDSRSNEVIIRPGEAQDTVMPERVK